MSASISVSPTHPVVGDTVAVTYTAPDHVSGLLGIYLLGEENGQVVYAMGGYPLHTNFVISQSQLWPDGHEIQGVARLVSISERDPGKEKVLAETAFPLGE